MNYKQSNVNGVFKVNDNFISIQNDNTLLFLSEVNFEILKKYDLSNFIYALHFYEKKIVLSNLKDKHLEIISKDLLVIEHNSLCYPATNYKTDIIFYCPLDKKYRFNKSNNVVDINFKLETKLYQNIIVECYLHQVSTTFIRAINLTNSNLMWQKKYSSKIIRFEQVEGYIIIDIHNKSSTTKILDILTGQEVWGKDMPYTKVDVNNNVILFSNEDTMEEVEITTGKVKSKLKVKSYDNSVLTPHFVDDDSVYYLSDNHSFGKINKVNGVVLWEFDLIDEKGEKRKLSTWYLLRNGKLVLQAMPNHPNGDLTCIFNPEENMQYSKTYPA